MKPRAGFLLGLVAAGLAAVPAALRFEADLAWRAFVVCTAGAALIMAPLSAALASPRTSGKFRGALTTGVLLAALPLIPFAALLKATTHHRPLAGVTFAVLAGLVLVAGSLFSGRLIGWAAAQETSRVRSASRVVLVALAALGTAAVLIGLVHGLKGGSVYETGFFDALRVLALATLAARVPLPDRFLRRAPSLGLAAWILVVTVGVCLGRAPALQAELAIRCPVLHWPLVWLGG